MSLNDEASGIAKVCLSIFFINQTKVIMLNVTKIKHSVQKLLEYFSMLMENQFQTLKTFICTFATICRGNRSAHTNKWNLNDLCVSNVNQRFLVHTLASLFSLTVTTWNIRCQNELQIMFESIWLCALLRTMQNELKLSIYFDNQTTHTHHFELISHFGLHIFSAHESNLTQKAKINISSVD